jgi:hypothetical protein
LSSPNKQKEREKRKLGGNESYCDPSYPQTTMQDFIINQAKMRQQYAATFKEDSPTKQLARRITVTGGSFGYTRQYSIQQSPFIKAC